MEKIIPTGERLLVKQVEAKSTYGESAIFIPEAQQVKERKAVVIAIGKNVTEVVEGDVIRYSDFASPVEMEHEGAQHLLLRKEDILAVIVNI